MTMSKIKFPVLLCVALLAAYPAFAMEPQTIDPQKQVATIDSVVAVVNDDVITRHELDEKMITVIAQLKKRGIPLPEQGVLEKQVLERMITEMLQVQYAKESGVRIDDTQLDLSMTRIAQQNNFPTLAAFIAKLEADGVDVQKFREEMRSELLTTRLRQREVESKLIISDTEVDNYIANKAKMGLGETEYHLAHILVVVPEQASADKIVIWIGDGLANSGSNCWRTECVVSVPIHDIGNFLRIGADIARTVCPIVTGR